MAGTEDDFAFLRDECKLLGELYHLGIFVEDPKFRNAILDGILEVSRLKGKDGISYLPITCLCNSGLRIRPDLDDLHW